MSDGPKLPRPLTDADFWRLVVRTGRWAEVDDKALFPAFMDRDPGVDPEVVEGVLALARSTAIKVARRRGLRDERDVARVKRKVLDEVRDAIALPRGEACQGLREAFFGRVVNIAAAEARKVRRQNRLAMDPASAKLVWGRPSPAATCGTSCQPRLG